MAKGSSGETGGGRLRSRFLSRSFLLELDEAEEEEDLGIFLASGSAGANGSPRTSAALPSSAGRGGGWDQASGKLMASCATDLSKAAKKGSSGGASLLLHGDDSDSGGGSDWEKDGKRAEESVSEEARAGRDRATDQTPAGVLCGCGLRAGEGSRNAGRKGSAALPTGGSLLCDTGGQAAHPAGSGDGPRVGWDGESRPESSTFSGEEESDEKAASETHR